MTMEHIKRNFRISLWVRHPSMDPQIVTSVLGLDPYRQHHAGEERRQPDGQLLGGTYPSAFWSHKFQVEEIRDLVPGLEKIVGALESHADFVRGIAASGGSTELFCGIFITTNWDESIPHELLGKLATLRIDLRLDAYPESENIEESVRLD